MDAERSEKLVAARKKLKKFQSRNSVRVGQSLVAADATSGSFAHTAERSSLDASPVLERRLEENSNSFLHNGVSEGQCATQGCLCESQSQAISVLVSEKSDLQASLGSLQELLEDRAKECSELKQRLDTSRRKADSVEQERLKAFDELSKRDKSLAQVSMECGELRCSVERLKASLQDQWQENTELVSRVTSQAADILALQNANTELLSKLNMSELVAKQLEAGSSPQAAAGPGRRREGEEGEGELAGELAAVRASLSRVTAERQQAYADITALRDTVASQQETHATRLAAVQEELVEVKVQNSLLSGDVTRLEGEKETLREQASAGQVEAERVRESAVTQLREERDALLLQVHGLTQDNSALTRLNQGQERSIEALQSQVSRMKEQAVDQHGLLHTITQDKETISRAMAQNKELKSNLAELEEAYVQLSQQNMELASQLDSERHRTARFQKQMAENEALCKEDVVHAVDSGLGCDGAGPQEGSSGVEHQLEQLQRRHTALEAEHQRLLQQREAGGEGEPCSPGQAGQLQNSFSALQQRFVEVMRQKADLQDLLSDSEHTIIQLSGEVETIVEYILLYQSKREALRIKFAEKDRFIQQVMLEKTAMQKNLRSLELLVKQLLAEKSSSCSSHPPSHAPPPPSPSLPLHLRPASPAHGATEDPSLSSPSSPKSQASSAQDSGAHTTQQILHILQELEGQSTSSAALASCPCCTGRQLLVV